MTFIQGIMRPERVWLCTDNRVSRGGRIINDHNFKYVGIKCRDGTALLSYTGGAVLPDGTKMSDWVRTTIRGESRTIEQTIEVLADRATKEISDFFPIAFIIPVFSSGKAFLYQISNLKDKYSWSDKPLREFSKLRMVIDKPRYYCAGSGMSFLKSEERTRLENIVLQKPRDSEEYLELLISVNKKIARRDVGRVSDTCVAVEMPHKGEPVKSKIEGSISAKAGAVPFVLLGIDTTETVQFLAEQLKSGGLSDELSKRKLEDIARRSVVSRK